MSMRPIMLGLGVALGAFVLDVLVVMALVGRVPITDVGATGSMVLPLLIVVVVVAAAARSVSTDGAESWLTGRGLPAAEPLRRAASVWLQKTRTARAVGFSLLLVSGASPAWLVNVSGLQPGDSLRAELLDLVVSWPLGNWPAAIAGYALGALVADLSRSPLHNEPSLRAAALQPRPVAAYLQPLSRWGPRVLTTLAVAVAAATALAGVEVEHGLTSLGLAASALIGLAVNEAVLHGIVRRRQPASDAAAIAFDDAARATTVHAVAGSTIGILGILVGDHLRWAATGTDGALHKMVGLLGGVLAIGVFGVWLGHGVGLAHRVARRGVTVDA